MRKTLIATASVLGLAFAFAGAAQAADQQAVSGQYQSGSVSYTLGIDAGAVDLNKIDYNAFKNATGVFNTSQNNGANSLAQQGVAVAAIIDCECSSVFDDSISLASSSQTGTVSHTAAVSLLTVNVNSLTGDAFNGATGVFNTSQNNAANSLTQQSVSVAAIIGK